MNEQTFPEVVEWKSATATIYRTKNRRAIQIVVPDFKSRACSQFITLRGQDAYEYSRSKELFAGTRLDILDLVNTQTKRRNCSRAERPHWR